MFTAVNVAHTQSRTFVSKSVALNPSDQHALLPPHALQRLQKGAVQAFNTFALRVTQTSPTPVRLSSLSLPLKLLVAADVGPEEEVYVLELEMLNFLPDTFPSTLLSHFFNVEFFPMFVRKIRHELLSKK
jgi:hypothetical protein